MKLRDISALILLAFLLSSSRRDKLNCSTVFIQSSEGYHTIRIPSIVQTDNGNLIAFAEGRRDSRSDPGGGHIDLIYKISKDRGRTWSSLQILEKSQEGWGASNPTNILLRNGRILILYNVWKPGRGSNQGNCRPGELDNQVWLRYSDNNGETWSEAEDITHQVRDFDHLGFATIGPGHGIETRSGRLLIPVNEPGEIDGIQVKSKSFLIYSDDKGENWNRGQQINAATNENQIVELDDGRIMIDARQNDNIVTRFCAYSNDQGITWSNPEEGQVCPAICAGIVKYQSGKNSFIVWSGIKGPGRRNLVLRISTDQGLSFTHELSVSELPAAYSDITLMKNSDIGILWESGMNNPYESIKFTVIPNKTISAAAKDKIVQISCINYNEYQESCTIFN